MNVTERLRLKSQIAMLESVQGSATGVVSLYVPPDRQLQGVIDRLRDEIAQSGNIKDRNNRHAVEEGLTMAFNEVRKLKQLPENGLIVFSGVGKCFVIGPPEPVEKYSYTCAPNFMLEPLKEMLESKEVFGIVVMDRKEASFGIMRGTRIKPLYSVESHIMGKHQAGGQSANRYARQIKQATHDFYKQVAEITERCFLDMIDRRELTGILLGGPGMTKKEWLDSDLLDYRVRSKVLTQLFETGYTDEHQGLREVVAQAGATLTLLELVKENAVVEAFFGAVRLGKAVYGSKDTLEAIQNGQVHKLLLNEDVAQPAAYLSAAEAAGTEVLLVGIGSDAGKRFLAFGGVGGFLRFAVEG
jgi:peptide chain release factor subunit 1